MTAAMHRFLVFWGICLLLIQTATVSAMYAEDAGVLDFVVATAGHGPIGLAHPFFKSDGVEALVLTTDLPVQNGQSSSSSSSCYVAARKQVDGQVWWRRNVCATTTPDGGGGAHAVAVVDDNGWWFSVDAAGVVRAWTLQHGALLWDVAVDAADKPQLWTVPASQDDGGKLVAVASAESLVLLVAATGKVFDTINGLTAIKGGNLKSGQSLQWLAMLPGDQTDIFKALVAVVKNGIVQKGDLYLAEVALGNDKPQSVRALNHIKTGLVADSLQIQVTTDEGLIGLALTASQAGVAYFSLSSNSNLFEEIPAARWFPTWTTVTSIEATAVPSLVRVQGKEEVDADVATTAMYSLDSNGIKRWGESPETVYLTAIYCPEANMMVAVDEGSVKAYHYDFSGKLSPLSSTGDLFVHDGDSVSVFSLLTCTENSVTTLLGTERGSTVQMSFSRIGDSIDVKVDWTAEEGLASLSSAVVLDATHLGFDDLVEEQDVVAYKLSFSGRLKSQWNQVVRLVSQSSMANVLNFSARDHLFGFVKVAALLSPKTHRIWGMDTSGGTHRGAIRWSLDLPKTAIWHSMVHGTTNSVSALHGINGGTHSREILVLSATQPAVEWMCIDGTSGAVNAQGSIAISSPILQVMPIYGSSTGGCRQASLLLHEDLTFSVVPADAETTALVKKQLAKTQNGLFAHKVDKSAHKVESYQVVYTEESSTFVARAVGLTSFAGEEIIEVAYPIRHEPVQSMSTILGDDSLLLKYINPHLAVVVTMVTDEGGQTVTPMASTIEKNVQKKPRKPAGAGATNAASNPPKEAEIVPNMFVNIIDTVSGRVLYRTSHSEVDGRRKISVAITENWVIYTYTHKVTRRTQIGVLTLHEGMIDSKGLTFFSSPEQTTSFSSLDARESKPAVLSKTYAFPKSVTAIGVTSTRQGISSQNILFAGADGSLTAMPRLMLETRRPMGDAKPNEKKEGLVPYRELVPAIPLQSLTYNRTMEPFTQVVAADTSLESQSFVLGFGGPDLFFSRTSPTKGFDLLPETFNKLLVGLVTVGIVIAFVLVQRMGTRKALQMGWI